MKIKKTVFRSQFARDDQHGACSLCASGAGHASPAGATEEPAATDAPMTEEPTTEPTAEPTAEPTTRRGGWLDEIDVSVVDCRFRDFTTPGWCH